MKLLVTAILFICCLDVSLSQTLEQRLLQSKPDCNEIFTNAMDVLPALKANGRFDSIAFVIDFLESHCGKTREAFDLKVLLAIQTEFFRIEDFYDSASIYNLQVRATAYNLATNGNYPLQQVELKYYRFTSHWAKELLLSKTSGIDQLLVLKTLAGEEKFPTAIITNNQLAYPYLYSLLENAKRLARKQPFVYNSFTVGYWVPTNNLSILGPHPTIGVQVGGHTAKYDLALTLQFKFLPAAHPYQVFRQFTLYDLDHFFGGYIGLDYTRILLKSNVVELGFLGGIGYDGFDIRGGENLDYLKPLSINSLNVNTGLRINFLYSLKGFIGLQGRYNLIDYRNKGGTNLRGDAVSIDLVFGFRK